MTTPNHPAGQPSPAWQRHHATTEAAMHAYLTTTHAAHRQYLTGPWPDRDAYNAVEVSAWMTYHAKCRAAWQDYTDISTCPCCTAGGSDCTCHSDCGAPRCQMADPPPVSHDPDVLAAWNALEIRYGLNCLECGIPWRQPSPGCTRMVHDVHPRQPVFTPNPESES